MFWPDGDCTTRLPVLTCAWPAAGEFDSTLASVPFRPRTGRALKRVLPSEVVAALLRNVARAPGVVRPWSSDPAPSKGTTLEEGTPSALAVLTSAANPIPQSVLPALTAARQVMRSAPRL